MRKFFCALCAVMMVTVISLSFAGCNKAEGNKGTEKQYLEGVVAELVSADLESENPYVKIRWINESEERITFNTHAQFSMDVDGSWKLMGYAGKSTETYMLKPGETKEVDYLLYTTKIKEPGKYRFNASFGISDSKELTDYYLDYVFEIK